MRTNDFFELSGFQNRIFERSSNKISILTELVDFSEFGEATLGSGNIMKMLILKKITLEYSLYKIFPTEPSDLKKKDVKYRK